MSVAQIANWQFLQALTPEFATPLVGPDFAVFVARHRPDAQVAIASVAGSEVAYFPFHPTITRFARGIGAPFCDYQAIVSHPEVKIDGLKFLAMAGIASFAFTSLMDPHQLFDTSEMAHVEAFRISCGETPEQRLISFRLSNPKFAKNARRLLRKLDGEIGPVTLVGDDTNEESFNSVLALKSAQYVKNGMTDVLRPPWVKAFMRDLFETRQCDFRGCLVTLYAGDKLIAGHFGVRQGTWFHPWIASTDPQYLAYSPGILFLSEAVQNCDDYGIKTIDMAEGHGHYKAHFCREPTIVMAGVLGAKPYTAPSQGAGKLAIINRRLDLIASVEPGFGGRIAAVSDAILAAPRRLAARRSRHHGE